jgi:hypothetical protein
MATTASFPVRESTEILIVPFWMYITASLAWPCEKTIVPWGYVATRRAAPADARKASVSKAAGTARG